MKILPQEIELWYIIPALRRAFALEMIKQGMKGREIASLLGVTKSAISQYINHARAVDFHFSTQIREEIRKSVSSMVQGKDPITEIQRILSLVRENKDICRFHHKKENLDPHCEICFQTI